MPRSGALLLAVAALGGACQSSQANDELLGYVLLVGALVGTALAVAFTTLVLGALGSLLGASALTAYWVRPGPVTRAICGVVGLVDLGLAVVIVAGLGCVFGFRPEAGGLLAGVLPVVGLGCWNVVVALRGGAVKDPGPS